VEVGDDVAVVIGVFINVAVAEGPGVEVEAGGIVGTEVAVNVAIIVSAGGDVGLVVGVSECAGVNIAVVVPDGVFVDGGIVIFFRFGEGTAIGVKRGCPFGRLHLRPRKGRVRTGAFPWFDRGVWTWQ
jgi:hypothetical protein